MNPKEDIDWGEWSREAGRLMQARNDAWIQRYEMADYPYHWDLHEAQIRFHGKRTDVLAGMCLIGTLSKFEGTFLWAWANETIPAGATRGLERVRQFGEEHGLDDLTTPEFQAGKPEALELLALAGRILDGEGFFISPCGDVTMFFVLFDIRQPAIE